MKKTTLTKKSKLINIICIVAILFAMYCQFISGWQFSGTINNVNTREERAMSMEMSIAGYIWQPYTEEATAFENYIKNPGLTISEEIVVDKNISDEQLAAKERIFDNSTTIVTIENDEAAIEQIVLDPNYNHDEVVAEQEALAAEAAESEEATEEEAVEEEVAEEEEEEEVQNSDAVVANSNMLVSIITSEVDPISDSQTTLLAESADKEAALKAYQDAIVAEYAEGETIFINGLSKGPAILLIVEILSLILIVLNMRKGKGTLFASAATFVIGLFSLVFFYSQPIFMLFQAGNFSTIDTLLSIVTVLGFVLTVDSFDYTALNKGALKFAKSRVFVSLISGIVLTVIGLIASKVLFVGTTSGSNSLSFTLGLIILVYGILVFVKAIIEGARDKALVKKASK